MSRSVAAAALLGALAGAGSRAAAVQRAAGNALTTALAGVTSNAVRAHAAFLADERLAGRVIGTAGAELAAQYLATQFAAMGLEPAARDGFVQEIPLIGVTPQPSLVIGAGRQTSALRFPGEFVAWSERAEPAVTADGEIVFAGFGSRPPGAADAFEGASLRGRIALMLVGDGSGGGALRAGEAAVAVARRRGAAGVLLVPVNRPAGDWAAIGASWGGERVVSESGESSSLRFGAWISESVARRLLGDSEVDFDALIHRARIEEFRPIPLAVNVAVHIRNTVRRFSTANIVARLPGADPARREEAVVLSTRYDGCGSRGTAEDAAALPTSGPALEAAVLISVASAFARTEPGLPRSIVFLATADGQEGVLGAEAFVAHSPIALHQIVAVIDLGSPQGGDARPTAHAAQTSTLGAFWQRAASGEGLGPPTAGRGEGEVQPTSHRHLLFARAGVPAISVVGPAGGTGMQSDGLLELAIQRARLVVRLGSDVATAQEFPAWHDGSEYAPAGLRLRRLRGSR